MPMEHAATASDDHLLHCVALPWYKGVFVTSVGGFLTLFLVAFQPFGVSNHDPDFQIDLPFLAYMLGAGLAATTALAISEFVLRPALLPSPRRAQLLAWLAWDYLLAGSVAYLYYNFLGDWHDFSGPSYLRFLPDVAMVISFPVVAFIFYLQHQAVVARLVHLTSAGPVAPLPELLHLSADNEREVFTVASGDLLFLESQDNYVTVVYLHEGRRQTRLLRSSLKRLEAMLPANCQRCHRSFVVNLVQVRACHGNQHGLKLHFAGGDEPVPVSRAYAGAILAALGGPAAPTAAAKGASAR
jgi:hypothetical protein